MATMTIKEQVDGVLQEISCDAIRDMTVRECYQLWDGKKIVCELVQVNGNGYICGTEKARDYYRKGGHKALTFKEALEIQRLSGYLDEVIIPHAFTMSGNVLAFEWGKDVGK